MLSLRQVGTRVLAESNFKTSQSLYNFFSTICIYLPVFLRSQTFFFLHIPSNHHQIALQKRTEEHTDLFLKEKYFL